jgi:GAF domain-containing protein
MARPTKQPVRITAFTTWLNQRIGHTDQATFAKDAGMSTSHLSLIRRGLRHPSRAKVEALADALGIPIEAREEVRRAAGYDTSAPATLTTPGPLDGLGMAPRPSQSSLSLLRPIVVAAGQACGIPLDVVAPAESDDAKRDPSDIELGPVVAGRVQAQGTDDSVNRPTLATLTAAVASCMTVFLQTERERAAIATLARSLSSTAQVEDLLCALLDRIAGLIDFDFGHITLVDAEKQELVVLAEKVRKENAVPSSKLRQPLSPDHWKLSQGVTGKAATSGLPVRVGDVWQVSFFIGHYPTRSELAVPLMAPHVIGVINLESEKVNHFTERDEQLLTIASATVASAVQRGRERERDNQWHERFTSLAELHRVEPGRDEPSFLQDLAGRVVTLFPEFHACVIRSHDTDKGMLVLMGAATRDADAPASIARSFDALVPMRASISGRAIEAGRAETALDVQSDTRFFRERLAVARGLRSMLVVPIASPTAAHALGSIAVYTTSVEVRFRDEHRRLLEDIARFLTIVLTNLRQAGRLQIESDVNAICRDVARSRATLDQIAALVVRKTGAPGALIYLIDEAEVLQKGVAGTIPDVLQRNAYVLGTELVGVAAQEGKALRILDPTSTEERAANGRLFPNVPFPTDALLVVPIPVGDHPSAACLGVIVAIGTLDRGFSSLDEESVKEVAFHLGVAIAREQELDALIAGLLDPVKAVAAIADTLIVEGVSPENRLEDLRTISLHSNAVVRALAETRNLREIHSNLEVTLRPEPLLAIIEKAVDETRSLATLSDVGVVIDGGFQNMLIDADRHRMEQAFTSLIENAVRYAERNTQVRIFPYGIDGVSCTTCIQDVGLPIDDADRERIFEAQYRSPAAKTKLGYGSGLGLSTARVIVTQLHGGAIRVTSIPDPNRPGVADVRFYVDLRMAASK